MRLVHRLPHALVGLAVVIALAGTVTAVTTTRQPLAAGAPTTTGSPSPSGSSGVDGGPPDSSPAVSRPPPVVAPLVGRVPAHVLVLSPTPLPPDVVRRLVARTGATATLAVASGEVRIGTGTTTGLGVDPSTFRAWTPPGTAESDAVWRSVAVGEGSVAHVVARAFGVTLGGSVIAAAVHPTHLRVGSFATTGLPGIGLVVDSSRSRELGLHTGTGLLLSAPQRDPEITAAYASDVVGRLGTVNSVQVDRLAAGRWVAPTSGPVSSPFGPRIHPITGLEQFHDGIDISAPLGAPVYAMSDGVVLYAGPATGFGTEVVLSHRGGVTTVYGHVSRLLVSGGHVLVGQPIALVGNEGESTGPHLHTEIRIDDRPVDPLRWLADHGVALH